MTHFDIVSIGELLVDFTPSENGDFHFNPGGGAANLAVAAANLGVKTAFLGKVGQDAFGLRLIHALASYGVYTGGVRFSEKHHTSLAFVCLAEDGERDFVFYHTPGADSDLCPRDLDEHILLSSGLIHLSTVCATSVGGAEAMLFAARTAKEHAIPVSFDPNIRPALWDNLQDCLSLSKQLFPFCDIVKLSLEELHMLYGAGEKSALAEMILRLGPALVVVTSGADGASWYRRHEHGHIPAFKVRAVDSTGAGDCFFGCLIARLRTLGLSPAEASTGQLTEQLRYAAAAAALCVRQKGGMPSLPDSLAVETFLTQQE